MTYNASPPLQHIMRLLTLLQDDTQHRIKHSPYNLQPTDYFLLLGAFSDYLLLNTFFYDKTFSKGSTASK